MDQLIRTAVARLALPGFAAHLMVWSRDAPPGLRGADAASRPA